MYYIYIYTYIHTLATYYECDFGTPWFGLELYNLIHAAIRHGGRVNIHP